ncbi:hypothetical protein KGQ20_00320 [Catenulispora sp. NF23]|uniref:Integrase n=1 Tax=Catenulispora pinistramenti TaxID=2705254 RepID=A0ABS5KKU6_9ACTN|nr:hypothetical protein [Catenulispora pinistramenti]MBS2531209.1 hypothetical protein [Catenulispora pinistramenti]MBS2546666.1 hypothetical protein [Catenulispora pinistramenti]
MMDDRIPERDLSRLVVPRWGRLVETGDRYEPYRLVDADGAAVEPVAVFFQELLASGKAAATVRSYGMDLLRWWRFLGRSACRGTGRRGWKPETSAAGSS